MLREMGLEPTRPTGHKILSLACLPFQHSRATEEILSQFPLLCKFFSCRNEKFFAETKSLYLFYSGKYMLWSLAFPQIRLLISLLCFFLFLSASSNGLFHICCFCFLCISLRFYRFFKSFIIGSLCTGLPFRLLFSALLFIVFF